MLVSNVTNKGSRIWDTDHYDCTRNSAKSRRNKRRCCLLGEKKGLTVKQLSIEAGLAESSLYNSLDRKWPKGDMLIAKALNMNVEDIWPCRYPNGLDEKDI